MPSFGIALEMEKEEWKAKKNNPLHNPPNTTNASTNSTSSNSNSSSTNLTKTSERLEIERLMVEDLACNNFEQIFGDCTNNIFTTMVLCHIFNACQFSRSNR